MSGSPLVSICRHTMTHSRTGPSTVSHKSTLVAVPVIVSEEEDLLLDVELVSSQNVR